MPNQEQRLSPEHQVPDRPVVLLQSQWKMRQIFLASTDTEVLLEISRTRSWQSTHWPDQASRQLMQRDDRRLHWVRGPWRI